MVCMTANFWMPFRAFIEEVAPDLKAVINEYGMNVCTISYPQNKGEQGKSNFISGAIMTLRCTASPPTPKC